MDTNALKPVTADGSSVMRAQSQPRYQIDPGASRSRSRSVRTRTGTRARTGTGRKLRTGTETRTQTAGPEDLYLVAIIENRAKEVGIAAYNLRSFDVELRQYTDTNTYTTTATILTIFS